MQTAWDDIRDLIDAADTDALISRLLALDPDERKLVAASLPDHIAFLRAGAEFEGEDDWEEPWAGPAELVRLAGAATLTAVTAVAAWLNRRDLQSWTFTGRPQYGDPEPIVRLLGHRPAAWQADLAVRLAARLRGPADPGAPLALAMLRHTGAEPPQHDPLVVAWAANGPLLPSDPLYPALLPRVFEAEGVGRALRTDLVPLHADREMLLDGCVRRFLRGGPPQDLRFFTRLHETLAPAAAEIAPRRLDYLRLLPTAPGPVAELALKHVRHLDHDPADVVEAVEALVFRAETKLARAGLSWLDHAVRDSPSLADDLAGALAMGFQHTSYEVQGRAAQLALKHRTRFGPAATGSLEAALPALPPALATRLAAAFAPTAADAPAEGVTPPPLPAPTPAEPFPAIPATLPEMEAIAWTKHPWRGTDRWQQGELWLAGFVRSATRDRDGLSLLLDADLGNAHHYLHALPTWTYVDFWITALARELIARPTRSGPSRPLRTREGHLPPARNVAPPHLFVLRRYAEVLAALRDDALPPVLLATPTATTGALDPDTLVARLRECEAAGTEPLPADLQQALIRLPRGPHPSAAARASTLKSEAARTAARWLSGPGLPDPETEIRWHYIDGPMGYYLDERPPHPDALLRPVPSLQAGRTGLPLVDDLLNVPAQEPESRDHDGHRDWWPPILPFHREIVAAHLVPYVLVGRGPAVRPSQVMKLAQAGGDAGQATTLLLAYFLGEPGDDAIVTMAANGALPGAQVGNHLGLLLRWTPLNPQHVANALVTAAMHGAQRQVWEVLRTLMPALLPWAAQQPQPRKGLAKIAKASVEVAGCTGARGAIPEVAAAAAGKNRSAFVRECRRLHEYLTRT